MTSTSLTCLPEHSSICDHCGNNTGLERVDATKLNSLVDTLTSRLSRDAHGNFFVEGSKTGKDNRHGQLGELFTLRTELLGIQATMNKYIDLHTPKEAVEAEKPGPVTKNMTAAISKIVEQQVAEKLRSLSIRCERVEEKNKALEAKQVSLHAQHDGDAAKIKDLQKQIRKASSNVTKTSTTPVRAPVRAYDDSHLCASLREVSKTVDEISARQTQQEKTVQALQSDASLGEVIKKVDSISARQTQQGRTVKALQSSYSSLDEWRKDTDWWVKDTNKWANEMDGWIDEDLRRCVENLKALETKVEEDADVLGKVDRALHRVETWKITTEKNVHYLLRKVNDW